MSLLDLAVVSVLAAVALLPIAKKAIAWVRSKPAAGDPIEEWRQRWVAHLIALGREVESTPNVVSNPRQTILLTRELTWEIIGGDQKPEGK